MHLRLMTEGNRYTLYSMEQGTSVCDYLSELEKTNAKEHAQIMRRLDHLANSGVNGDETQFRKLGNDLFEAKARLGPRVLFFYDAGSIVICALGLTKQSQKTPKHDIKTALRRKKAYFDFKTTGDDFEIFVASTDPQPRRKP